MSRRATLRTAGSTRGKEVMVDSTLVTILDSQAKKGTVSIAQGFTVSLSSNSNPLSGLGVPRRTRA